MAHITIEIESSLDIRLQRRQVHFNIFTHLDFGLDIASYVCLILIGGQLYTLQIYICWDVFLFSLMKLYVGLAYGHIANQIVYVGEHIHYSYTYEQL